MNPRHAFVPAALLFALSSLAWPAAGVAATAAGNGRVSGALIFPGSRVPALRVYAWAPASRQLFAVRTPRNAANYQLEVPPGNYWLFALPDEPGAPQVFGAHSEYTVCTRELAAMAAADCTSHALVSVTVTKGSGKNANIDIADWYLSDAVVAELSKVVGQPVSSALPDDALFAAPKFSEYTVPVLTGSAAPAPTLAVTEDPRVVRDLALLRTAAAGGVTFAGHLTLIRTACGAACSDVALIDLETGEIHYPPELSQVPTDPCGTDDSLQYRSDSRLLVVTRRDGSKLLTIYYLWQPATHSLAVIASLAVERAATCTPASSASEPAVTPAS